MYLLSCVLAKFAANNMCFSVVCLDDIDCDGGDICRGDGTCGGALYITTMVSNMRYNRGRGSQQPIVTRFIFCVPSITIRFPKTFLKCNHYLKSFFFKYGAFFLNMLAILYIIT